MKSKRMINPVDIQDRDGFLRFLTDQAREGWAAVKVGLNATWFQETDRPPKGYTMWINPNGGELRDPAKRAMFESREDVEAENAKILEHRAAVRADWKQVKTYHWFLEIYAMPEPGPTPVKDWEWDALENWEMFGSGGRDILRGVKGLIFPIAALVLLLTDGMAFQVQGMLMPLVIVAAIVLCSVAVLGAEILAQGILAKHRKGLIEARREGRRYTTPEEIARKVPLKNRLEFCTEKLKLLEIGLLILMFLIWL